MFNTIYEERLKRLTVRKYFHTKYNDELINFLEQKTKNKEIIQTLRYISKINFTHVGLNSQEYIVHPLRLAVILYQINNETDTNTLIVALLHNILEVSEISEKDFLLIYNEDILHSLQLLKVNRVLENNLDYKKKYYDNIITYSKELATIKAIDKFDNLFLLCLNSNKQIREAYLDEIEKFIYPIVKESIPILFEYFKDLVDNCRELGFLDRNKSIQIYNKDYS